MSKLKVIPITSSDKIQYSLLHQEYLDISFSRNLIDASKQNGRVMHVDEGNMELIRVCVLVAEYSLL